MATKRSFSVRSRVYSFSDDNEDEIQCMPSKRPRRLSKRESNAGDSDVSRNIPRRKKASPSCDHDRMQNVADCNDIMPQQYSSLKKKSCSSSNAVQARENRIKKKIYVNNLENDVKSLISENKKIRTTLGTQSEYITDLEKEINYLKNLLANSKEIGLLLRSVHAGTGLPVTTSMKNGWTRDGHSKENLSNSPAMRSENIPYSENNVAEKLHASKHIPTPPTSISSMSPYQQYSPTYEEPSSPLNLDVTSYLSDDDFSFNDVSLPQFSNIDEDIFESVALEMPVAVPSHSNFKENTLNDHTYSSSANILSDNNPVSLGVCLHISNRKVSLEFCAKCNEKAALNWQTM